MVPYFSEIVGRVRQLPAVNAVSLGSTSPMEPRGFRLPVSVGGAERATGSSYNYAVGKIVSAGFFADLGIRVVAGREFAPTDDAGDGPGRPVRGYRRTRGRGVHCVLSPRRAGDGGRSGGRVAVLTNETGVRSYLWGHRSS